MGVRVGGSAKAGAATGTVVPTLRPRDVIASFDGPVGAYVHVPFCEWICPFCPYNKVLAEEPLAGRYFAALKREVEQYVDEYSIARGKPFTSLYIGGGTPTLYPEQLAELLRRIPVSGECAIEVLPTHGTRQRFDELAAAGITAVSIGAQSFHDDVLRRLHRPHDAKASRSAVENSLGHFECVDVDLIVDVEWDDENRFGGAFLDDVRTCFELGVDQVSTYPLMRFGYTPFGIARHDRRREHEILRQAGDIARSMGYESGSVWTFNRRGSTQYTSITRRRFLGMGAGSSSFAGRDFYVNHFGVATYAQAVEDGRLPIARWLRLGRVAGAAYDTFWRAYAGRVDASRLSPSFGGLGAVAADAGMTPFVMAGLLTGRAGEYRLTPRGFDAYHDLERLVTYEFIEPLWAEMLREHAAEPGAAQGRARWVASERGRTSPAWSLACRLFEQK